MKRTLTLQSSYDNVGISLLVSYPDAPPHAVLQLVHGMCGCKERFMPLIDFMTSHGIACVAGDHRGHGASIKEKRDLGYMYHGGYKALVEDMKMVSDWSRSEFSGLPLFLLGHSMGALAARVYTKKYDSDIDGLILCGSPSWNPATPFGIVLTWILMMLNLDRFRPAVFQELTSRRYNRKFISEGHRAWTCSDPQVRESFAANPLCNFNFTVNADFALLNLMRETYSDRGWAVNNSDLPIYFISGEDDPCMESEGRFHDSAKMMTRLGYTDVSSAIFPSMRHEVLNEIGHQAVWSDILEHLESWLHDSLG